MVLPLFSNFDHCALSANASVNSTYDYNGVEKVFDFKKCDFEHFSMYLRNSNWFELLYDESIDIDGLWDRFMYILRHYVNQFVPKFYKQVQVKTSKTNVTYPSYILRLQENKRKCWENRHFPGGLNMYLNTSKLYSKAVKRLLKNREIKLLKLGQNGFYTHINKRSKSRSIILTMSDDFGTIL